MTHITPCYPPPSTLPWCIICSQLLRGIVVHFQWHHILCFETIYTQHPYVKFIGQILAYSIFTSHILIGLESCIHFINQPLQFCNFIKIGTYSMSHLIYCIRNMYTPYQGLKYVMTHDLCNKKTTWGGKGKKMLLLNLYMSSHVEDLPLIPIIQNTITNRINTHHGHTYILYGGFKYDIALIGRQND